jgi:SsrA-binding protein
MPDVIASNDRARYDYDILETFEAGLALTGQETKSAKTGHFKLKGAFVTFHGDEAFLTNSFIAKYSKAGPVPGYDPERSRKLLLHRRELARLQGKRQEEGLTIVPIRAYIRNGRIKVEIGIGRGKRQFEKRASIKKREADRQARALMKLKR